MKSLANQSEQMPNILQEFIARPGMFIIEKSVYGLKAFLDGYMLGSPAKTDIHEFVMEFATYVGGDTSTLTGRSWAKVLMGRTHDKYSALQLAIDLIKEFHLARASKKWQVQANFNDFSESMQPNLHHLAEGDKTHLPGLLQRIRKEPESVLDERSIQSMRCYLSGYELACSGDSDVCRFLIEFDPWVATYYALTLNLSWDQLISIFSQDSHHAIEEAFEMMDKYISRSNPVGAAGS